MSFSSAGARPAPGRAVCRRRTASGARGLLYKCGGCSKQMWGRGPEPYFLCLCQFRILKDALMQAGTRH